MQLRLVTRSDEELVRTINMAARTSSRDVIASYFYQKYIAKPFDPDAGFAYGVCCYSLMAVTKSDLEIHRHLMDMIEGLSAVLACSPNHWLARYYRALAGDLVPPGYSEIAGSIFPVHYGLEDTVEDRYTLIQQQKEVEPLPYFLCPYLGLADYYMLINDVDRALSIFEQGLVEVPLQPVTCLAGVFFKPFLQLFYRLKGVMKDQAAARVKDAATVLFPNQVKNLYEK